MDLLKLTKEVWETYFLAKKQKTLDMMEILDPECIIIGTGKHEFYKNIDEFAKALAVEVEEREDIQFQFKDFWCEEKKITSDVSLVYGGIYIWWESEDKSIYINMDSRFSFLYKKVGEDWRLIHIHQSMPNMEQLNGEYYPKTLSNQIRKSQEKINILTNLARRDSLTGLMNYRTFEEVFTTIEKNGTWLFVMDLDDFKHINDTFGHMAGNNVLQKMAGVLTSAVRSHDIVCRMGGDEFILLCNDLSDRRDVGELLQRLLKSVADGGKNEKAWPGISIGGTAVLEGETLEAAFQRADSALYTVKTHGKNQYMIV